MNAATRVAALPDAERTRLLDELAGLVPEGTYVDPLCTHLYLTTLSEGG